MRVFLTVIYYQLQLIDVSYSALGIVSLPLGRLRLCLAIVVAVQAARAVDFN